MINPTIALLSLLVYSFGVALSQNIFAPFFLAPAVLASFKPHFVKPAIKRLILLNFFIILVAASPAICGDWRIAALVFTRSNLIVFFALLLVAGESEYFAPRGILGLGLGDKIASLFYLGVSFVTALRGDFSRIKRTLAARGFVAKTSIFTYRTYAGVAALLALGAFERAEAMKKTMLARGFAGRFVFAQTLEKKAGAKDFVLLAVCVLSVILREFELI